jgi:KaiC/GvpD/RAD55 family RecA-like ATPase
MAKKAKKAARRSPSARHSTPKKRRPSSRSFMSKSDVERVKTGVEGFDELVEGGLLKNSFILLSGATGTGKSIFAMNFLAHGAMNGENGVYVSMEEGYDANKSQMKMFGWDIDQLQKEKKLIILQPKIYDFDKLVESIQDSIAFIDAKRVVIDSISILQLYFEDKFKTRRSILDLAKTLKNMGVTTIAIAEVDESTPNLSRENVEEFVADGVIVMYLDKQENLLKRGIGVRKLRSTNHSLKIHPMQIKKPNGIVVYPFEETFSQF